MFAAVSLAALLGLALLPRRVSTRIGDRQGHFKHGV
jgi:hypothetical protein